MHANESHPPLRAEVAAVRDRLLDGARAAGVASVGLDAIGDAIGTMRIDSTEIDALLSALELAGCSIAATSAALGRQRLRAVLPAVRALKSELQRKPSVEEIAARCGLEVGEVRHALLLARVMSRGA